MSKSVLIQRVGVGDSNLNNRGVCRKRKFVTNCRIKLQDGVDCVNCHHASTTPDYNLLWEPVPDFEPSRHGTCQFIDSSPNSVSRVRNLR